MYHPIVKEQVLPGQLEELQTNLDPTETQFQSQAEIKENKNEGLFARIVDGVAISRGNAVEL